MQTIASFLPEGAQGAPVHDPGAPDNVPAPREGAPDAARASASIADATGDTPFTPDLDHCPAHGAYPRNMRDAEGTVRWFAGGCPPCAAQRRAEKLFERACIAPRFAHCGFDNFIVESDAQGLALSVCEDYARRFAQHLKHGACLILRGAPGTGKNHLATAITRALIARGHGVINATAYEVIRRVRDTWARGSQQTEREVLAEFAAIDLLIIDEAGRAHRNREGAEPVELFHIIDARYRLRKPTMVLSNLGRDELPAALGPAAFDRLREGGGALVHFDWPSHRGTRPQPDAGGASPPSIS